MNSGSWTLHHRLQAAGSVYYDSPGRMLGSARRTRPVSTSPRCTSTPTRRCHALALGKHKRLAALGVDSSWAEGAVVASQPAVRLGIVVMAEHRQPAVFAAGRMAVVDPVGYHLGRTAPR